MPSICRCALALGTECRFRSTAGIDPAVPGVRRWKQEPAAKASFGHPAASLTQASCRPSASGTLRNAMRMKSMRAQIPPLATN